MALAVFDEETMLEEVGDGVLLAAPVKLITFGD
jgi:hypothetical protein